MSYSLISPVPKQGLLSAVSSLFVLFRATVNLAVHSAYYWHCAQAQGSILGGLIALYGILRLKPRLMHARQPLYSLAPSINILPMYHSIWTSI